MVTRLGLAFLFLAHGVAHVVGFLGAWRLSDKIPYKTTLFAGAVDVGDGGIRAVGVAWLLAAAMFAAAAVATVARAPWWPALALTAAVASLAMCVAGLPDAKIGVAVNLALIGVLVAGARFGWFVPAEG